MMTMMMVTMPVDLLFAVAVAVAAFVTAYAIASEIAFEIASLPQKSSYALVYASIRHMGSVHLDVDKTHAFAMHLCCVKRANKHCMHTFDV